MRTILFNAQNALAIELMVAAQAVDWRVAMIEGVPEAHDLASAETQAQAFVNAVQSIDMQRWLGRGTGELYRRVRDVVAPLVADRPLSEDIRNLARVLTR